MRPKPEACRGCPMYSDGLGFVPDEYVEGALVHIKGQGPGKDEESEGIPFTGATGQKMNDRFLPLAGLTRGEDVSIGNTIRCRWTRPDGTKTDDLPPDDILQVAVEHCRHAHERIPSSVRLVLAQGQVAWKACGGPGNIHGWRGYLKPEEVPGVWGAGRDDTCIGQLPVLATVHLANLRFWFKGGL